MFSPKEVSILQALVEDEISQAQSSEMGSDPTLRAYQRTLSAILLKLKIDDSDTLGSDFFDGLLEILPLKQRLNVQVQY